MTIILSDGTKWEDTESYKTLSIEFDHEMNSVKITSNRRDKKTGQWSIAERNIPIVVITKIL